MDISVPSFPSFLDDDWNESNEREKKRLFDTLKWKKKKRSSRKDGWSLREENGGGGEEERKKKAAEAKQNDETVWNCNFSLPVVANKKKKDEV